MMKKNKMIIIGKNSFIGKSVSKLYNNDNLITIGKNECDFTKSNAGIILEKYFKNRDNVIFLSGIPRRNVITAFDCNQNISMACTLADAIKKYKPKHCIYASSIDVYGFRTEKKIVVNNNSPLIPTDLYGISKVASENILSMVCKETQTDLLIVRITGVYGKGEPHGNPIGLFMQSCENGESIRVTDSGKDIRAYIFVEDAARVLLICAEKKITGILNLVGPKSMTIMEYAKKVQSFFNKSSSIEVFKGNRPPSLHYFDRSKLFNIMAESQFTTLEKSLEKSLETF